MSCPTVNDFILYHLVIGHNTYSDVLRWKAIFAAYIHIYPYHIMSIINKPILSFINTLSTDSISAKRKNDLTPLIDYIQQQKNDEAIIRLNFICTHNSRRSHLCQVWAKAMAAHFEIKTRCYSGGTEVTAVYPTVIETLKNIGFTVEKIANYSNPTYKVNFTEEKGPMTLFSKRYNDAYNPRKEFAAVMTCTDADEKCPIIADAERISLPYEDPKVSDGTPQEAQTYNDRSTQIAAEMKYVFSQIK